MKKLFFALIVISISSALYGNTLGSNEGIMSTLLPITVGDMSSIKDSPVETHYFTYTSFTEGIVQVAMYKNGGVSTILTWTPQKYIGTQSIFHEGKEMSTSSDYCIDTDHPDTVIHVHKKYLVYTSQTEQRIVPRKNR